MIFLILKFYNKIFITFLYLNWFNKIILKSLKMSTEAFKDINR